MGFDQRTDGDLDGYVGEPKQLQQDLLPDRTNRYKAREIEREGFDTLRRCNS